MTDPNIFIEITQLRFKQEEELHNLVHKLAGKKHGKVSLSKITALSNKHIKQLVRLTVKIAKKEAKKQMEDR
jgi:hypothetical protein